MYYQYLFALPLHVTIVNSTSFNRSRKYKPSASTLVCTRWFKYDRDYLCVNKSQFVPVIFEPPCTSEPPRNQISRYV
jgi:hypothetical protein